MNETKHARKTCNEQIVCSFMKTVSVSFAIPDREASNAVLSFQRSIGVFILIVFQTALFASLKLLITCTHSFEIILQYCN